MKLIINNKVLNVPNHINIMGFRYDFKQATNEEIQDFLGVRNENDYGGAINYYKQVILLNKEEPMADESKLETIIHECVHGVSNRTGMDLDEETVVKLGLGLTTVFKEILGWVEDGVEL